MVFWFARFGETWLGNNASRLVNVPFSCTFGKHGYIGNNVSWSVHIWKTWLKNKLKKIFSLGCTYTCPPLPGKHGLKTIFSGLPTSLENMAWEQCFRAVMFSALPILG
jgi:hypothetical protein